MAIYIVLIAFFCRCCLIYMPEWVKMDEKIGEIVKVK